MIQENKCLREKSNGRLDPSHDCCTSCKFFEKCPDPTTVTIKKRENMKTGIRLSWELDTSGIQLMRYI